MLEDERVEQYDRLRNNIPIVYTSLYVYTHTHTLNYVNKSKCLVLHRYHLQKKKKNIRRKGRQKRENKVEKRKRENKKERREKEKVTDWFQLLSDSLAQKRLLICKQVDLPICLVDIMTLRTQELNKAHKKRVNMRVRRLLQQLLFMSRPICLKGPIFT